MVSSQLHYTKVNRFMPFLLAEILNFQCSINRIGVGSFSNKFYYTEKLCRMEAVAAVAMADIKDFKRINESFGHQTGDDVLRRIAGVLHDAVGKDGDVLRYSGDNFVMVFSDISNDKFEEILEKIRKNVESLVFMELPGVKLELNVSGVCRPGKVDELLDQVRI